MGRWAKTAANTKVKTGAAAVNEGVLGQYLTHTAPLAKAPNLTDTLTPAARSERMSRIQGKDTQPEMKIRRLVHGMGYRYRLHRRDLPGKPDLVFASRRKVIFVHGCFWHRHPDNRCKLARIPKSRLDFWQPKLENNRTRDLKNQKKLAEDGWQVLVLWECELRDASDLEQRIRSFLEDD
jgi:DNA mismatch endonuclease (patch repair protein)